MVELQDTHGGSSCGGPETKCGVLICEQPGRTTGLLGSTGLQAMPSEGLHSWPSGANLPLLSPPGLDTISVGYGPPSPPPLPVGSLL